MATPENELPSLEELQRKIDEAESLKGDQKQDGSANPPNIGAALRPGLELVSGVAAGCLVGYGLDHLLGATPWFLIVGMFLGAAGGFRNLMRMVENDSGNENERKDKEN